jgi:hypothetical protein
MRLRWRLVLPAAGLLLFSVVTYQSAPGYRSCYRYFWWSSTALDSDPLARKDWGHPRPQLGAEHCDQWDPGSILVRQGRVSQVLTLSAFPAFLLGWFIVDDFSIWGISQLTSFMIVMPLLIGAWFYLVGWLIERWTHKRAAATAIASSRTVG